MELNLNRVYEDFFAADFKMMAATNMSCDVGTNELQLQTNANSNLTKNWINDSNIIITNAAGGNPEMSTPTTGGYSGQSWTDFCNDFNTTIGADNKGNFQSAVENFYNDIVNPPAGDNFSQFLSSGLVNSLMGYLSSENPSNESSVLSELTTLNQLVSSEATSDEQKGQGIIRGLTSNCQTLENYIPSFKEMTEGFISMFGNQSSSLNIISP